MVTWEVGNFSYEFWTLSLCRTTQNAILFLITFFLAEFVHFYFGLSCFLWEFHLSCQHTTVKYLLWTWCTLAYAQGAGDVATKSFFLGQLRFSGVRQTVNKYTLLVVIKCYGEKNKALRKGGKRDEAGWVGRRAVWQGDFWTRRDGSEGWTVWN